MRLHSIFRYPVKGLDGDRLSGVQIEPGQGLPGDRQYGLAMPSYHSWHSGNSGGWAPKQYFVHGAQTPKALQFKAELTDKALTASKGGQSFNLRQGLDEFGAALGLDAPLTLVDMGHSQPGLTDQIDPYVSIANIETARWLAKEWQLEEDPEYGLNPTRFKNSLWLDGLAPWEELSWIANRRAINLQGLQLRVIKNIGRCANINADPKSGLAPRNLVQELTKIAKDQGHVDTKKGRIEATFGVFAVAVSTGELAG